MRKKQRKKTYRAYDRRTGASVPSCTRASNCFIVSPKVSVTCLEGGLGHEHDALAVLQEREEAVVRGHDLAVVDRVPVEARVLEVEADRQILLDVGADAGRVGAAARVAAEGDRRVAPEEERSVERQGEVDAFPHLLPGGREARRHAGGVVRGAAVVLRLGEARGGELRRAAANAMAHGEEHVL